MQLRDFKFSKETVDLANRLIAKYDIKPIVGIEPTIEYIEYLINILNCGIDMYTCPLILNSYSKFPLWIETHELTSSYVHEHLGTAIHELVSEYDRNLGRKYSYLNFSGIVNGVGTYLINHISPYLATFIFEVGSKLYKDTYTYLTPDLDPIEMYNMGMAWAVPCCENETKFRIAKLEELSNSLSKLESNSKS